MKWRAFRTALALGNLISNPAENADRANPPKAKANRGVLKKLIGWLGKYRCALPNNLYLNK
jgi:hypothetical protein